MVSKTPREFHLGEFLHYVFVEGDGVGDGLVIVILVVMAVVAMRLVAAISS